MSKVGTLPSLVARRHLAHQGQFQDDYCDQTSMLQQEPAEMMSAAEKQQQYKNSTTPGPAVATNTAAAAAAAATSTTTSSRRRISKACDRCYQLRTKCDGLAPCRPCVDNKLDCTYARQRKKRGKVPRKDVPRELAQREHKPCLPLPSVRSYGADNEHNSLAYHVHPHGASPDAESWATKPIPIRPRSPLLQSVDMLSELGSVDSNQYLAPDYPYMHHGHAHAHTSSLFSALPYPPPPLPLPHPAMAWDDRSPSDVKYPVLRPVLPYTAAIISHRAASDLLEHYFSASSVSHPHPRSPYIVTFMFGKRAFFRQHNPRVCSPALLSSMLWVAARTSDIKLLSASPSFRAQICQKLFDLTIKLLRPLLHRSPSRPTSSDGCSHAASADSPIGEFPDSECAIRGADGTLDDVATYIHLGVVVSASEQKGPSLRWWNAAWGLARELKLGRELPLHADASTGPDGPGLANETYARPVAEEEREERRRVWWLLFCMDRHLSLCYNKPICLPDRECESLLLPMDEHLWQNSDHDSAIVQAQDNSRPRGPPVEYAGPSLFGWFLPLMVILGEIVDLNHARSHPRCGADSTHRALWDEQFRLINLRLHNFEESMRNHEMQHLNPAHATLSFDSSAVAHSIPLPADGHSKQRPPLSVEAGVQLKKNMAYATHITHVLHILLTGRWDPLALLDDADMWIYSDSFVDATGHAVSAAQAASQILEHDPDMSFMPFVFGIYLLQGSFLLLLMADKLQRNAAPNIVEACEIVVRAHEACTVTLSTEYQRNFRNAMRSALNQVKGHCSGDDCGEEQRRRRELLSLYRWSGDGTGIDTE